MRPSKYKDKIIYLVFIFLLIFCTEKVYAATREQRVCLSDGTYYKVSWDDAVNTEVKSENIDATAIKNGHVAYPGVILENDKTKYAITSSLLSFTCSIKNGSIKTCDNELGNYSGDKLIINQDGESNVIQEFNVNTGKFTIKIKDPYNGKAKLRVVGIGASNDGTKKAGDYNSLYSPSGGYFIFTGLNPSVMGSNGNLVVESDLKLEVYVNNSNSDCNNYYASSITVVVDVIPDEIANPALTNPSGYGCDTAKNLISKLKSYGYSDDIVSGIRSGYVPLCYSKTITYDEYNNLSRLIQSQVIELQNLVNNFLGGDTTSSINTGSGFWCDTTRNTKSRVVLSKTGTYWNLTCWENYEIDADNPKLVRAGGGFTYQSTFKVNRICSLKGIRTAVKKPQCHVSCSASCSYDERAGRQEGKPSAGPSEDFDSCIYSCDAGTYTQECINSCYQQTYSNDRTIPELSTDNSREVSFLEDSYKVERLASSVVGTVTSNTGCNGTSCSHAECPSSFSFKFSNYCNTHNGSCTITKHVGPGGCSWNPEAEYNSDLASAHSEKASFESMMGSSTIDPGSYTIQIDDSYLVDKSGNVYLYQINIDPEKANINMNNSITTNGGCTNTSTVTVGASGNSTGYSATVSACTSNSYTKTITVNLANSYLNKRDGNAVYQNELNKYVAFDTSSTSSTNKLKNITFNRKLYYSGGNRYYTNVLSGNTNVVVPNDGSKVTLIPFSLYKQTADSNRKSKIKVSVSGLGTGSSYSDSINCFYGVYNDTFCQGKEECPSNVGDLGIQFIFRPIDLTDVFPNERSGRWNWTNGASTISTDRTTYNKDSLLNYKIQPELLTEVTEDKGYTVYNDSNELDYEIILTPQNIKNIRKYNKKVEDINKDGSNNYLDYDMTCGTKNNRDVCYSKFLDNTNYITYGNGFNSSTRKDIAICNNAYSQDCTN